jgi:hypothetical protein
MSELNTAPDTGADALENTQPIPVCTHAVITEQEVKFASAAAVPVSRHPYAHRLVDAIHSLAVSTREWFRFDGHEHRPVPRRYPRRYSWLERSEMSREMDRL